MSRSLLPLASSLSLLGCGPPAASDADEGSRQYEARPSFASLPDGLEAVHGTGGVQRIDGDAMRVRLQLLDETATPIPGVLVSAVADTGIRSGWASDFRSGPTVGSSSARTDHEGRVDLPVVDVDPGDYHTSRFCLVARAPGFEEFFVDGISIGHGVLFDLGTRILRPSASCELEFLDSTGHPLAGVGVVHVDVSGGHPLFHPAWWGASNEAGRISIDISRAHVEGGEPTYGVTAVLPQHAYRVIELDPAVLSAGGRHTIRFDPPTEVRGRLVGAPSGREFSVSVEGWEIQSGWVDPWNYHQYATDHPILSLWSGRSLVADEFRAHAWSTIDTPLERQIVRLWIRGEQGRWHSIDSRPVVSTTRDGTAEWLVPQIVRLRVPPAFDTTVPMRIETRAGSGSERTWVQASDGGERIVSVARASSRAETVAVHVHVPGYELRSIERSGGFADTWTDLGDLELIPLADTRIRIVDAATGSPIDGATWTLTSPATIGEERRFHARRRANALGIVEVPTIGGPSPRHGYPGFDQRCAAPGYRTATFPDDAVLRAGTWELGLEAWERTRIRVVDERGAPRADVGVQVGYAPVSATDAGGWVVLRYGFIANAREFDWWTVERIFPDAQQHAIHGLWHGPNEDVEPSEGQVYTLPRHSPFLVRGVRSGRPLISMRAELVDGWVDGDRYTSHPSARIDWAAPGPQTLWVCDDSTGVSRIFTVEHPGANGVVVVDLTPATLRGRVERWDGQPLARAGLTIAETDIRTTTDADGTFVLDVTTLGVPLELCVEDVTRLEPSRTLAAFDPGEERALEVPWVLPRTGLRICLGQSWRRRTRVRVAPKGQLPPRETWADLREVTQDEPVVLHDLEPGDYEVEFIRFGFGPERFETTIVEGECSEVVLD